MRSAIVKNTLYFGSARCLNRYLAAVPAMSLIPFAPFALPAENFGENQRRNNCRVGFDDEFRRRRRRSLPQVIFSFGTAPEYDAVARGGIADLAEVAPERHDLADEVLVEHRHDANREIARDAAADLEKADRGLFCTRVAYHFASSIMYSMPERAVCEFIDLPVMMRAAYMLPSVESSQPGTKIGRFFCAAAIIQLSVGSIS